MVQAGYTAIYNDIEINFYDSTMAKISVSEAAVLTGYVCPWTQLWRVPLVTTVRNKNTDTLLLDHPCKHESLNVAPPWNPHLSCGHTLTLQCQWYLAMNTSTTFTNSPASNGQSDIFTQRWVSPLRNHGSGPYGGATITLGL